MGDLFKRRGGRRPLTVTGGQKGASASATEGIPQINSWKRNKEIGIGIKVLCCGGLVALMICAASAALQLRLNAASHLYNLSLD